MRKAIIALAAMATIVIASIGDAEAQRRRGGAVAAGVIGGLAAGAIIGGAIAASRPAYAVPAPVYVDDYPACRLVRERFWDGYGWRHRRVEVCN